MKESGSRQRRSVYLLYLIKSSNEEATTGHLLFLPSPASADAHHSNQQRHTCTKLHLCVNPH
ncbi:hypothetical protein E2C01_046608 [Portunus trituberculatus]|uniref:Uncharacterized protein n=1 Tax=Portunus trituberculatus TaxID=210409 RepID=A0A5B7G1F3_PORTR|nr:hypothetical protein [Portunus trituberculatus]